MGQNSTPNAFNSGSVREMKHFSDSIVCRWRKWAIKSRRDRGNFSATDKGRDREREEEEGELTVVARLKSLKKVFARLQRRKINQWAQQKKNTEYDLPNKLFLRASSLNYNFQAN